MKKEIEQNLKPSLITNEVMRLIFPLPRFSTEVAFNPDIHQERF